MCVKGVKAVNGFGGGLRACEVHVCVVLGGTVAGCRLDLDKACG